ncbi:MAG: hypothetical protein ACI9VS_001982 [Candidatus Binatia bacterium]|jgi:hypothetical protein
MVPKRRKPQKTFADYVAILIAPLLIMAMVGSLVFFLLEVFVGDALDGQIGSQLRWVMFWFVIASVLVGRISVQQGSAYAGIYAFGLAAATGMWIVRFFGFVPIPIALLALIWWATHKLTWDVTLIDEDEDASGEGLLQAAGVDMPSADDDLASNESTDEIDNRIPWWKRIFTNTSERKNKAHSPGLWIIWISLFALLVFGFGQLGVDEVKSDARQFTFKLLLLYIASALALLLCASFLGLRRYLRQRLLQMPANVTRSWITLGLGMMVATILACLLLPRPDATMSLPQLIDKVSDAAQQASDWAFLKDGGVEDEDGRKIGEGDSADPEGENGAGGTEGEEKEGAEGMHGEEPGKDMDEKAMGKREDMKPSPSEDPDRKMTEEMKKEAGGEGMKPGETAKTEGGKTSKAGKSGTEPGEGSGDGKGDGDMGKSGKSSKSGEPTQSGEESGPEKNQESPNEDSEMQAEEAGTQEEQSTESKSETESNSEWIGSLVKWLIYAALLAAALYFGIKHRKAIMASLRQFWANLIALFTGKPKTVVVAEVDDSPPELPPFNAFSNPFATGAADSQSPEELVRYTFEALQAWAKERDLERPPDQTPIEFARRLGAYIPDLAYEAGRLTRMYSGFAYAGRTPPGDCSTVLQALWSKLTRSE